MFFLFVSILFTPKSWIVRTCKVDLTQLCSLADRKNEHEDVNKIPIENVTKNDLECLFFVDSVLTINT